MKKILKKLYGIFNITIILIGRINVDLYYMISGKFHYEHKAVYNAILSHKKLSKDSLALTSKLRRNIHRIEKGLTMPQLKDIFAEAYILETIKALELLAERSPNEISTLKWSKDILDLYFKAVKETPIIKKSADIFFNIELPEFKEKEKYVPFLRSKSELSTVSYSDFHSLMLQRRSIRWYEKKPIDNNIIEDCVKLALLSPSACNRQPFRFLIFKDSDKIKEMAQLPMGVDTFKENIPMLIFLIGDLSAYEDERDRHLIYVDGGLVSMSFVLALETKGLSSCIVHWPAIPQREKKLRQSIDMTKNEQCVLCISVGYAIKDSLIPCSIKKSLNEVLTII